jgi:hypothetical protein
MSNHTRLSATFFTAPLLFFSLTAAAENSTLQPILTHFAKTQSETSLDLSATSFSDVELDEVGNFDGWTAALDITVPFENDKQVRFFLPFHTDGDARLTKPGLLLTGKTIDIEGDGGVFNYATMQYEQQVRFANKSDYNLAYTIGGGFRTKELETTHGDKFNHTGRVLLIGAKADSYIYDGGAQLLVNAGIRFYHDADDLNPENKDSWTWADIKTAAIFGKWGENTQPIIEVTYLGDFSDYNDLAFMPELILSLSESVSLKVAGIVGLGGDGNQSGAVSSLSLSF